MAGFALGKPIANGFEGPDALANMTSNYADYTYWADFIFQAMFAATAATIVSGAVAERIKLGSFMIGATLLVAFVYPITGSWRKWGGGWLDQAGFYDFAGSTLVHAFGGFAALAAVLLLGSRKGKCVNGQIKPILGHSMPLATIGAFLLFGLVRFQRWFRVKRRSWFGIARFCHYSHGWMCRRSRRHGRLMAFPQKA